LIFWVAAVFLLPVSPIWPPRRPFLPYGRPNLALAGILVQFTTALTITKSQSNLGRGRVAGMLYDQRHTLYTLHCAVNFPRNVPVTARRSERTPFNTWFLKLIRPTSTKGISIELVGFREFMIITNRQNDQGCNRGSKVEGISVPKARIGITSISFNKIARIVSFDKQLNISQWNKQQ